MKNNYFMWIGIILLLVGFFLYASITSDTFVPLIMGLIWSG